MPLLTEGLVRHNQFGYEDESEFLEMCQISKWPFMYIHMLTW